MYRSAGHARPPSGGFFHLLSFVFLEEFHVDLTVGFQPVLVGLDGERSD